jgi:hypothetical protein
MVKSPHITFHETEKQLQIYAVMNITDDFILSMNGEGFALVT